MKINKKIVVLGVYAGRSGSKSLTTFLHQQKDSNISWENSDLPPVSAIGNSAARMSRMRKRPERFIGDVDYRWLWHLKVVRGIPDHKIVYLFREAESIARSFMTYLPQKYERKWKGKYMAYPVCDTQVSYSGVLRCVKQYQQEMSLIKSQYGDQIVSLHTEDLNDDKYLQDLLRWIGYPEEDWDLTQHNIPKWKKELS